MAEKVEKKSVQTFGKKKTATAVAFCCEGKGSIKVNGCPLDLVEPEILRHKVFEPVRLLGEQRFSKVDIRIRVRGGGFVAQIYAIRQAIAKAIVAYNQKCVARSSPAPLLLTFAFFLRFFLQDTWTRPARRRSRRS